MYVDIYLKKIILFRWPLNLFLKVNTQTMHIKSILYNSIDMFPKKPNTLAGFEPGSSVPEADAMSTPPWLVKG
jgi:hypothetical protein